ncbi:MAG: hypothetical protein KBA06_06090 [Saprospiraceae bacterium]|nr:hypothetical protein [Saprospiraceae bacterium]
MMILVADSGSTKCDWAIIHKNNSNKIIKTTTVGLNPFYCTQENILEVLTSLKRDHFKENDVVGKVFFYGAGCSNEFRNSLMKNSFQEIFPSAEISIDHDLLGAAKAVCGTEEGIACILGTGSNSCLYDGNEIVDNITNLGFLLGDEGSGAHLGKLLIQSYFYREMPNDISTMFKSTFIDKVPNYINHIYNQEKPNVFLASLSTFCLSNINHPFINQLCKTAFGEFFDKHILKYHNAQEIKIHFVGSIAYHFKDVIADELKIRNLQLGKIVKGPIDQLVEYHISKEL